MEFAASVLSSMASAAAPAAAAVGSAASAVAPALGGASIVGSILSGSASLLQMSQLRAAGRQQGLSLDLAAQDTRTDVAQENIQGTARAQSLRRALLDTIGERDAAYAASGIDIGFGTPAIAREEAVSTAESALAQDSAGVTSRVSRLNERAANLRVMARQARRSGADQADIAGLSAVGKILARG